MYTDEENKEDMQNKRGQMRTPQFRTQVPADPPAAEDQEAEVPKEDLLLEELEEEELEEETEEERKEAGLFKRIWNSRAFSGALIFLSVVFLALGIYFFVKPMIIHRNQDKIAQELLDRLKQQATNSTEEISIDVPAGDINLPGSYSDEYDYIYPPGVTHDPEATDPVQPDNPTIVTIRTDAIMRIPKINLEIAVAPDVNASSLWVLPGHYPSSPQPGSPGVAAYFGHRMYGKGRHFNRLNEVNPGDKIQVQRKGMLYTYVVETSDIIEPSALGRYVYESSPESRILLVTCHPIQTTGIPKYRIVIRGALESAVPVG